MADHDSGRLVWVKAGRTKKTVEAFFDAPGADRCARIRLVSADAAEWIGDVVADRCDNAVRRIDPFHVTQSATEALDDVRRDTWNAARRAGQTAIARQLKTPATRCGRTPKTSPRDSRPSWPTSPRPTNRRLSRAYLLKEQLRQVFAQDTPEQAIAPLDAWVAWASRSQLPAFVKLARRIRVHKDRVRRAVTHGLSNARWKASTASSD